MLLQHRKLMCGHSTALAKKVCSWWTRLGAHFQGGWGRLLSLTFYQPWSQVLASHRADGSSGTNRFTILFFCSKTPNL